MAFFRKGAERPVKIEDANFYHTTDKEDLIKVLHATRLESDATKMQIQKLIKSSEAVVIADCGREAFMLKAKIRTSFGITTCLKAERYVVYNEKDKVLLKYTI